MKLQRAASQVLSITAIAWGIPLAQAEGVQAQAQAPGNPKFVQLDINRDGFLSKDEVKRIEGHAKFFGESDDNRDGKLDASEFIKFQSLQDRAYLGRVTDDSAITARVKAALLREQQLKALDVSVETYRGEVLLSGFVKDEAQRKKALQ
ncbi:MAG: BON domain-containing protein, partial [Burkholderiales bacterium]